MDIEFCSRCRFHLWSKKLEQSEASKSNSEFKPSMKILSKIMQSILEKNSLGRTSLSQITHTNYQTISRHVEWLKQKSFVDITLDRGKVHVELSSAGRDFALKICSFDHL